MAHNEGRFQCPRCQEQFITSSTNPACPKCGFSMNVAVIDLSTPSPAEVVENNRGAEYLGDGVYAIYGEEIQEWKGIELVGLCPFRHADKYNEISAKVKAEGEK